MTIGEKILNLRKARGWSQEELAERIGVSRQAVSRWESDSAKPDADKIIALCDLFGVSADYLLRDVTPKGENLGQTGQPLKQRLPMGELLAWGLSAFGTVSLFILGILSSVNRRHIAPSVIQSETGEIYFEAGRYTGLSDYLQEHGLGWLFWMAVFALGIGLVVIIVKHGIHRRIWKWIDS